MTWTIGIFEREQDVLDAAQALQERGGVERPPFAVVNNTENAPLLSARSDLRLEGLEGRGAIGEEGRPEGDEVIPAAFFLGSVQGSGMNGQAGAIAAYSWDGHDWPGTAEYLERLGITADASRQCAPQVEEGKLLLLAETESLEETAALLRSCGASDVVE
ncbi:hypothetical protein [Cohnella fermenti]|uniref:General stress protein 17M-like domain-containing protein n=1 Tax=Cohnella fermenti TaxID=2565925 RepID=A0A4S4BF23_9BACL|nr:hypothetical protein [Cohnella fermenti]THF72845.1 hypothetical protein E6C55_31740 [Cohnella fermenti]